MNSMMLIVHIIISLLIVLVHVCNSNVQNNEDLFVLNMTLKNYHSIKEDQIVYVKFPLPDEELTILGYIPLVVSATAHHMNTMACENPFSTELIWTDGSSCGSGAKMLLYGWDRDALPLLFPQDIGVAVGKNTPYKYIVINIHFVPIVKNDYSGNQFIFSRKRRKYLVGVVTGGPEYFTLPAKAYNVKTPFSCQYHGSKLSIFAVGLHAHQWARVNSLYRVRNGNTTLIAKVNPQKSYQTYQLPSRIEILDGDYLIGQCIFDNNESRRIITGLSHKDEMCNVMAGYIYEQNDNSQVNSRIPFEYCWGNSFPNLINLIPHSSEILTDDVIITQVPTSSRLTSMIFYTILFLTIIAVCLLSIKALYELFISHTSSNNRTDGFQQLQEVSDEENDT